MKSASAISTAYFISFIGLGMVASMLGPALPDLAAQTGVQLKQVSLLFTAIALGYLIGALVGGRLYDRRRGHPIMGFALLMMSVMVALAPLIPNLGLLMLVILLVGVSQGMMDVGGNTLLVWLHGDKNGPYMIALHLFWGVGNSLAPLLIAQSRIIAGNFAWGYWVIALVLLPFALMIMRFPSPSAPLQEDGSPQKRLTHWPLVVLFMLFFLLFAGSEGAYGGWLYSYALATGIATESVAAYMTSVYWGAFTLARLISIPLSFRFRAITLLIVDVVGCLVGLVLAVLGEGSPTMIWIATIILGASIATLFPVALTFASEVITVTGQFTSLIFVGVSLGGMLIPWVIGQFFEPAGPQSAMWILLLAMLLSALVFALLVSLKNRTSSPPPRITP